MRGERYEVEDMRLGLGFGLGINKGYTFKHHKQASDYSHFIICGDERGPNQKKNLVSFLSTRFLPFDSFPFLRSFKNSSRG